MRYLYSTFAVTAGMLTCAWTALAADPPPAKPAVSNPAPKTTALPTPPPRPIPMSTSVVDGAGNTVIIGNHSKGTTIIHTGGKAGKRVVVHNGQVLDLDKLSYKGKSNGFWRHSKWHAPSASMLYWCPKTALWFRYHVIEDAYRPATDLYLGMADDARRQAERHMMQNLERANQEMRRLQSMFEPFPKVP
jgi:hypothetical protein